MTHVSDRTMRARWRGLLTLGVLLAGLWALPAPARETIEQFHSDIVVNADGSLEVTETIAVRAEGREVRRGLIREFPTRYTDRFGNRVVVGFEMLSVQRNGTPEPFWTERSRNGVEVYLGDDSLLQVPRTHTYTLRYRTTRQLGFFAQHDELYWNVTGTGWDFPILVASARVRLPQPVPAAELDAEGYTGPQGAKGRALRHEVVAPGEVRFETTQRLGVREGLTIVLGFPKGIVDAPDVADRAGWLLADNAGVLVALAGFLSLLAWYLWKWHHEGRDPAPGVVFPHYEPPGEHRPGALRYVRRMGWDDACMTADLVDAAVHGALTIHRETPQDRGVLATFLGSNKEVWRLQRTAESTSPLLSQPQRAMLAALFERAPRLELRNTLPETVASMKAARGAHSAALKAAYTPAYFAANLGVIAVGVVWSLVYGVLALVLAQGAGLPLIVLLLLASAVLHLVFVFLMRQPTALGRRLLDATAGLKLYLSVAERDELERLAGPGAAGPAPDPERYVSLLPYAMALDVAEAWTDKFERAADSAAVAQAQARTAVWYRGDLAQVGSLGDMGTSLGSTLGAQIASSSSPPGSRSGGGGGGFSGGGGGGGGGGGR